MVEIINCEESIDLKNFIKISAYAIQFHELSEILWGNLLIFNSIFNNFISE